MGKQAKGGGKKSNMGKAALLVGAAGLLLFIVGVKRRYRVDDDFELDPAPPRPRGGSQEDDAEAEADE